MFKIRIVHYKSIDDLTFDIKKINESFTTILLGRNESGKSNILDAMYAINTFYENRPIKYKNLKSRYSENERTSICYTYDLNLKDFQNEQIISLELFNKLEIKNITQEIYIEEGQEKYNEKIYFDFNENLDIVLTKENEKIHFELKNNDLSEVDLLIDAINNPGNNVNDTHILLKNSLIEIITDSIHKTKNRMNASIWKPQPEYTVCENIRLDTFSQDVNTYPLLKNIFSLADYNNQSKISQKISEIKENSAKCNTLENKLSNATTSYINKKWPELNISFDVRISKDLSLDMHVYDNDNIDNMYLLSERSEGFKQFISMLLSISIDNQNGGIKNKLILIDEPEVHLHPSGIRYMNKELLKIGQNNFVVIATHSNFMVDANDMERHYIIKREQNITQSRRIQSYEDVRDEEILLTAFGINYLKEFTSPYKMVVEGKSDKVIFAKAINHKEKEKNIVIVIGTGSSVDTTASIIAGYDVYPIILVDSDQAGKNSKFNILSKYSDFNDKVFTIRDLCSNIIENGTIEDTLDLEYIEHIVKPILEEKSIKDIHFTSDIPICKQIETYVNRIQGIDKEEKKETMNNIKAEISNNLVIDDDIKHPKLLELTDKLIKEIYKNSR